MSLSKTFMKMHEDLGTSLGIKTVDVREYHTTAKVNVTRFILCLNPFNEAVYLTKPEIRRYRSLGLSIRRMDNEICSLCGEPFTARCNNGGCDE